jgi:DNA-binding PadR family transcriptional regulator
VSPSSSSSKPLPAASMHVALALLDGELHGYALMRRVEELSDGAVRMGPGTLYGTINRLLEAGLVVETTDRRAAADASSSPSSEGDRRRYYELTADGRAVALDEVRRLAALVRRTSKHLRRAGTATA